MIFLHRKWLRTQLWLLTFVLVCVLLIVAEPSIPMLIAGAICTIVCLFNAYLEFMVTAIFIRPLQPKNSAQGSQWISHFGVHKGLQTHIQVHSSAPENPLIIFIHGWRSTTPDLPVEPIKTVTNDHFIGPGYGRADQAVFDTLAQLARLEGITLDPVYTGKAFHGMVTDLEHSSFQSDAADIIFVHTGGVFGIFPHADALQTSLQRVQAVDTPH